MLLHTHYSYRLLGALVAVFLISYLLERYRTSYIAISIHYFPVEFNLKGRLYSRLVAILITYPFLIIIPPKCLAILF